MQNAKKMSLLLMAMLSLSQFSNAQAEEKPAIAPSQEAPAASAPATPAVSAPATPTASAPAAPAKPVIEQQALDRLKQMSDTLIASKSFSYRSKSAVELLADNGQFVTFFTEADVALQRPNKLQMNVTGDTPDIHLYFDGTKASAIDKENNIYAISPAMSNIDEMLDYIMTKAQIGFPSADLMYSNPYGVMTKNLTDAIVIGESMVNGTPVDHFAYREPNIDWEIWIAKGEKALPMRLAMTYKQVEGKPSFLVEFANWKLNPKLKDKLFEFKAPSDGKQIEFGNYSIPSN
jgi:hypothetical protein